MKSLKNIIRDYIINIIQCNIVIYNVIICVCVTEVLAKLELTLWTKCIISGLLLYKRAVLLYTVQVTAVIL